MTEAEIPIMMPLPREKSPFLKAWDFEGECANCGRWFVLPKRNKVYCSLRCDGEAKAVRYGRKKHSEYGDPRNMPEDIRYAVMIKIAHALAGGYDEQARVIPEPVRLEVWARDSGLCVLCCAPAEEIDHINGAEPVLTNLRLLCRACHRQETLKNVRPVETAEEKAKAAQLNERITTPEPARPCDSSDWGTSWRTWRETHRRLRD